MKTIYEITAVGFDGDTDDTDNRVIWVSAPDFDSVRATLSGVPYGEIAALPDSYAADVEFELPDYADELRAALIAFVLADALVVAESFMSGFEDDELQEGMVDTLGAIRAALSLTALARPGKASCAVMSAALDIGESFMSGFEDDELQDDMPAMLAQVRDAIRLAGQVRP